MVCNIRMEQLLSDCSMDNLSPDFSMQIWKKITDNGQPYWGTGNFCGLSAPSALETEGSLCWLEWDGNEVNLGFSEDITGLLKRGLSILKGWKLQLEQEEADTAFDLLLSVDLAEVPEIDVLPSVTLRFWAVRDDTHCIDPTADALEPFDQPVLIEMAGRK